jgi:hypothetical protein
MYLDCNKAFYPDQYFKNKLYYSYSFFHGGVRDLQFNLKETVALLALQYGLHVGQLAMPCSIILLPINRLELKCNWNPYSTKI